MLRTAAGDSRWRVREAVAIALQRIGERDFETLRRICDDWLPTATLLERRAIVAALAHPPMLGEPGRAAYCLEVSETVASDFVTFDAAARRAEEFRVLRQGLEYAVSVFAAHDVEPGFALLERWLRSADADLRRVARSNLGKARLAKKRPTRVAALLSLPVALT